MYTKEIHSSGVKLIIEQEDMNDIMKIIKALENSGILLKGVSKTIKNETKEQRGGFLSMLLGTLGASLLVLENEYKSRRREVKKTSKLTATFSSFNKNRKK